MMLGDTECDADLAYYLKYGKEPPLKRCKFVPPDEAYRFDKLNYLEANHQAYFENPRRHIWGY